MKKIVLILYFSLLFLLSAVINVSAYIDPATTSYIIQIIAGILISLSVFLGILWRKILNAIRNFRIIFFKNIILFKNRKKIQAKPKSNTSDERTVSEKLREIFYDNRKYKSRLLIAGISSLACTFSFIFFGFSDLFISNNHLLKFSLNEFIGIVAIFFIACMGIMTVFLSLFKGKIFDWAVCLVIGATLAGYIQGNFLNLDFGQLTGDQIKWHANKEHAIMNFVIWIVIISIPFLIRFFSKRKTWSKVMAFVAIILVFMQSVGLISSYIKNYDDLTERKNTDYFLSYKGSYELSSKENVIVLIIDRLDGRYVDELVEDSPKFLDELDGFTYYENATSLYARTFPSVSYMLTDKLFLYDYPAKEYFTEAWDNPKFFNELHSNNYTTKLYAERNFVYLDPLEIKEEADNLIETKTSIKTKDTIKSFAFLSAFRYSPYFMKSSFWMSTDEFSKLTVSEGEYPSYETDDITFYEKLVDEKIQLQDEKNNFVLYHLNGSHPPFVYNEKLERLKESDASGTMLSQTKGAFKIVFEYLNQMKELGIYDNSTIIIAGDHGQSEDNERVSDYKTTGVFIKPKGESGTPMKTTKVPYSHSNFQGTILDAQNIDSELVSRSVFKLNENDKPTRKFYYRVNNKRDRYGFLQEFDIIGDAEDFKNWTLVKEHEIRYPHA